MPSPDLFPAVTLSSDDYVRLLGLVAVSAASEPDVSDYLGAELERATVVRSGEVMPTVVMMNACVTFRNEATGRVRTVTLVYPSEADLAAGKVSVLTPIGAALIGVAEGHSICWYTRSGEAKTLTVLEVEQ
ncbi:nucleoside diphosphate kinase regulator [Roseomonas genomospecies 6]|uniref:Nucleoside diphosphate kinase regulator n=1 Tax=Roseomonas genomospecies 6 TaxID=214106 RepID=A0A9W7KP87_9PROT|nr:nucleoside diphosphate kinase regulator [Roseomonas genomospecies 6]KAA0676122.1 nucleoside diphosphate kinase regulator [Roseomonas genomospecies 6]